MAKYAIILIPAPNPRLDTPPAYWTVGNKLPGGEAYRDCEPLDVVKDFIASFKHAEQIISAVKHARRYSIRKYYFNAEERSLMRISAVEILGKPQFYEGDFDEWIVYLVRDVPYDILEGTFLRSYQLPIDDHDCVHMVETFIRNG